MTHFIVDKTTGNKYRKPGHYCDSSFATAQGAKTSLTKMLKKFPAAAGKWTVMSYDEHLAAFPVTMVPVTNLMTGKVVMERSDTPRCCSVGSELYWTM